MNDFTLVVGVDKRHLWQLSHTWPTWKKNKPSLLTRPMIIFFDHEQVTVEQIRAVVDHPNLSCVAWPPSNFTYGTKKTDKWDDPQREKMLSGFVFVPAAVVETPFWLKLDTDVVATGQDDWIDPEWFKPNNVIISHPWGFTRPPNQMLELDEWATNGILTWKHPPLNLAPKPGEDRVCHPRIITWCAFFNTNFTWSCADCAKRTCAPGYLPVPSQDGFLFYVAKRMGYEIIRPRMKKRGFSHWSSDKNVKEKSEEAMKG